MTAKANDERQRKRAEALRAKAHKVLVQIANFKYPNSAAIHEAIAAGPDGKKKRELIKFLNSLRTK